MRDTCPKCGVVDKTRSRATIKVSWLESNVGDVLCYNCPTCAHTFSYEHVSVVGRAGICATAERRTVVSVAVPARAADYGIFAGNMFGAADADAAISSALTFAANMCGPLEAGPYDKNAAKISADKTDCRKYTLSIPHKTLETVSTKAQSWGCTQDDAISKLLVIAGLKILSI